MRPRPVRDVIGYYVGDPSRLDLARRVAAGARDLVTGLAPWPRPERWPGPWVELPGALDGQLEPVAEMSSWLRDVDPALVVVDGSREISLLVRLHGVPVLVLEADGDVTRGAASQASASVPLRTDDPDTVVDLVDRWTAAEEPPPLGRTRLDDDATG